MSNERTQPPGALTVWSARLTVIGVLDSDSTMRISSSTSGCGSWIVSRPILAELLRKMSANPGAITALTPIPWIAQTACSRDEPQPKFGPASITLAPSY